MLMENRRDVIFCRTMISFSLKFCVKILKMHPMVKYSEKVLF